MTECADIILLFCKEILGKKKRRCFRVQQKQSQKQKLYFALKCLDIVTHSFFSLSGTKNIHFFSVGNQTEIGKRRKEGRKKDTRSTDSFLISSRLMALSPPIVEAQATVSFLQFLCKSERFIYT